MNVDALNSLPAAPLVFIIGVLVGVIIFIFKLWTGAIKSVSDEKDKHLATAMERNEWATRVDGLALTLNNLVDLVKALKDAKRD